MSNKTFITVPKDLTDLVSLRRFLERLIQELDRAYGNRSTTPFASSSVADELLIIYGLIDTINNSLANISSSEVNYLKKDGSRLATGILKYDAGLTIVNDHDIVDKKYVIDNFTNNPKQTSISSLAQSLVTVSATYTQSEVQTIATNVNSNADKIDAILSALRSSNLINL